MSDWACNGDWAENGDWDLDCGSDNRMDGKAIRKPPR